MPCLALITHPDFLRRRMKRGQAGKTDNPRSSGGRRLLATNYPRPNGPLLELSQAIIPPEYSSTDHTGSFHLIIFPLIIFINSSMAFYSSCPFKFFPTPIFSRLFYRRIYPLSLYYVRVKFGFVWERKYW